MRARGCTCGRPQVSVDRYPAEGIHRFRLAFQSSDGTAATSSAVASHGMPWVVNDAGSLFQRVLQNRAASQAIAARSSAQRPAQAQVFSQALSMPRKSNVSVYDADPIRYLNIMLLAVAQSPAWLGSSGRSATTIQGAPPSSP